MKSHLNLIIALVAVGGLMITSWFLTYKQLENRATPVKPTPFVSVTIYPIYDIVRNVVGPEKSVSLIVPPGTNPLDYQIGFEDVNNVQGTVVLFTAGHGIDDWSSGLIQNASSTRPISVDGGIEIPESDDPQYYWLSIKNAQIITQNIADILSSYDPENTKAYYSRAEAYRQRLADLYNLGMEMKKQSKEPVTALSKELYFLANDFSLSSESETSFDSIDIYGGSIAADTYLTQMKNNLQTLFGNRNNP